MRNQKLGVTRKIVTPIEPAEFEKLIGAAGQPVPTKQAEKDDASGLIDFADFQKVHLKTALILEATKVEKSEKLIKLKVQIGDATRQIVAGIAQFYSPESLVGKHIVVVENLKPAKLMGHLSEGMLLAAKDGGKLALVTPDKPIASGASIS
jgi:methionyl-tRNA synthetase